MNTAELKLKLFRHIDELDQDKLEDVYGMLLNYIESQDNTEGWNELTPEQQKGIKDVIQQMKSGEGLPHEKVMQEFKNRFNA